MTTEYYTDGWYLLCDVQKRNIFIHDRKIAKTNYLFVLSAHPPTPCSNSAPTKNIFVKFYIFIFFENLSKKLISLRTTDFIKFNIWILFENMSRKFNIH